MLPAHPAQKYLPQMGASIEILAYYSPRILHSLRMIFYLCAKPARGWAWCIPASTKLGSAAGGFFKEHGLDLSPDEILSHLRRCRTRRGAGCRRRRAGRPEGAPAAEDGCAHHGDRRGGFSRARGSGQAGSLGHRAPPLCRQRCRRQAPGLCGHRRSPAGRGRIACSAGARHPGQRRRCAGALHLHYARHRRSRSGHGGDRHRRRRPGAGARDQDPARAVAAGQPRHSRQAGAEPARPRCRLHTGCPRAPPPVGASAARPVPPRRPGWRRGRGRARARRRAEGRRRTEPRVASP